jgi:putative two-component system response regulator
MRLHCASGAQIIGQAQSDTPLFDMAQMIALSHHEKWDGTGYPQGLAGEAIPVAARVVAIADVFDALTSRRPYKEAWSLEKTFNFLSENAGTHFDPELVEIFVGLKQDIIEVQQRLAEPSRD